LTTIKFLSYFYLDISDFPHLPDNQAEVTINLKYYCRWRRHKEYFKKTLHGEDIYEEISILVDTIIFLPLWKGKCRFLYMGR
jgi:hypothetical protein